MRPRSAGAREGACGACASSARSRSSRSRSCSSAGISGRTDRYHPFLNGRERAADPQVFVDLRHRGDRRGDRHHLRRHRPRPGAVIALASVVTGELFVEAGWGARRRACCGLLVGGGVRAADLVLVIVVQLPPFIATLGVMGITRGVAFIITEGATSTCRGSAARLAAARHPARLVAPIVMIVLALVFQILMTGSSGAARVLGRRQRDRRALLGHRAGAHQDVGLCDLGVLAAVAGVVLALVQGQGKADLATGYELDIIASAVVGGASLSGGRGSVMGAVLGTLIFGVLRNALPQIPGATFYDRPDRRRRGDRHRRDGSDTASETREPDEKDVALVLVAVCTVIVACGGGGPRRGRAARSCASPSFRRRSTSRCSTTRRSAPSAPRRSSATSRSSGAGRRPAIS